MTESFLCGWKGHGRHSESARLHVGTAEVFDDDPEWVPDFRFFAGDDDPISNQPFGLNWRFAAGAAWKSLFYFQQQALPSIASILPYLFAESPASQRLDDGPPAEVNAAENGADEAVRPQGQQNSPGVALRMKKSLVR